MLCRWSGLAPLGLLLAVTAGCPEEGDEAGDEFADADTGETAGIPDDDTGDGDGDGDRDVRALPSAEGGCDDGGEDGSPIGDDVGDIDHGGDDGGDGDGDGDGDGPIDHPERCWDDTWNGDVLPHVILGNTTDRIDNFTGSCGIGAAPDYQLGFTAPWTGSFTFDTSDSSFDTVLYVITGECGEIELACNDDFIGQDSKVTLDLEQGAIVTVNVDGSGPFEDGLFKLEISETVTPVCETDFIPPNLPTVVQGDTSDASSQLASGCGGEGAREKIYEFVAPGPGTYRFDSFGSTFDTVLYALDECDGPPLICNDDAGFDLQSELFVDLSGGQKIMVVVDGFGPADSGQFLLNVQKL